MKKVLIILLLLVGSCSSLSYFYLYRGEVGKSNRELEKVAEKGKIIIDALEKYKKDSGEYPLKLDSLYPKYISHDVNHVYDFSYLRGDDQTKGGYYTNEEIDEWGGYVLTNLDIKQWVIGSRSWYLFEYHPSKKYPERKWEKPKKRVKDWALILSLRRYGSKVNPIVGPGV